MKLQIKESGERLLVCKKDDLVCKVCRKPLDTHIYYCEDERKVFCFQCRCRYGDLTGEHTHWKVDKVYFEDEDGK